jgi:FeS assembly SUF system protein
MAEDIEHLKQHKIVRRDDGRVRLSLHGQPASVPDVDEAVGGSGEAPAGPIDRDALRADVVEALKRIFDPEIPVNIYDLGLIYDIEVGDGAHVEIHMTLTAPACPVAGMIVTDVARRVGDVPGVRTSHVKLVWDPPWTQDRMTEEAKLELGLL